MSQEGYDKLVAELHQLESVELPQVREAIAEARDKGGKLVEVNVKRGGKVMKGDVIAYIERPGAS